MSALFHVLKILHLSLKTHPACRWTDWKSNFNSINCKHFVLLFNFCLNFEYYMTNLILYLILYLTSISSIFDPLFDPILDPFFIHYFIHYFIQIVEKRDILFELFVDYYLVIIRWIIWSINYRSMLNSIVWLKSFKWWTFYLSWLTIIWLLFDDYSINRVIWFIHWLFEHWLKFSFKFFILLFQHS